MKWAIPIRKKFPKMRKARFYKDCGVILLKSTAKPQSLLKAIQEEWGEGIYYAVGFKKDKTFLKSTQKPVRQFYTLAIMSD